MMWMIADMSANNYFELILESFRLGIINLLRKKPKFCNFLLPMLMVDEALDKGLVTSFVGPNINRGHKVN